MNKEKKLISEQPKWVWSLNLGVFGVFYLLAVSFWHIEVTILFTLIFCFFLIQVRFNYIIYSDGEYVFVENVFRKTIKYPMKEFDSFRNVNKIMGLSSIKFKDKEEFYFVYGKRKSLTKKIKSTQS